MKKRMCLLLVVAQLTFDFDVVEFVNLWEKNVQRCEIFESK